MYDATLRIIIFGDFFEERQAVFEKFLTNYFVSDKQIIGVDFKVKNLTVDGLKVKLQVDDFDGKERFKYLLPTYMRAARGGLFVYDVTNYSSLAHIDDWLSIINFNKDIKIEDLIPIVVVGIVPNEMCERQVSAEEAIKIAKSRNLTAYIECNLKTGKNVEKAFEALTRLMLANIMYNVYRPEGVERWDESYSNKIFESGGWPSKKTIRRDKSYSRSIFKSRNRDKVSPKLPSRQPLPPPKIAEPQRPKRPATPVSLRGSIMSELRRLFSNRTKNS